MNNVTRREVTPGDTAQGTVCTKVLIKLLGSPWKLPQEKAQRKEVEMDPRSQEGCRSEDRCCHKAVEDEADKGPLNIVFESY